MRNLNFFLGAGICGLIMVYLAGCSMEVRWQTEAQRQRDRTVRSNRLYGDSVYDFADRQSGGTQYLHDFSTFDTSKEPPKYMDYNQAAAIPNRSTLRESKHPQYQRMK